MTRDVVKTAKSKPPTLEIYTIAKGAIYTHKNLHIDCIVILKSVNSPRRFVNVYAKIASEDIYHSLQRQDDEQLQSESSHEYR